MDYFGLHDEVAALLSHAPDPASAPLDLLLTLAWYLRQRDPQRCKALADAAREKLGSSAPGTAPDHKARQALRATLAATPDRQLLRPATSRASRAF